MRVPNVKFWSARQRGEWKLVVHIAVVEMYDRGESRDDNCLIFDGVRSSYIYTNN